MGPTFSVLVVTHNREVSLCPTALRSARSLVWHSIRRDASAFEYELGLYFFAGLLRESLTHRERAAEPAAACATNTAGSK